VATQFTCAHCDVHYSFRECLHCGEIEQVERTGEWWCIFCRRRNRVAIVSNRKPKHASAETRYECLNTHGLTTGDQNTRLLGGFTHIGGTGFGIVPGSVCSVAGLSTNIRVSVEIGASISASDGIIDYEDLTAVDLGVASRQLAGDSSAGGSAQEPWRA
jgi:hypothetical protein